MDQAQFKGIFMRYLGYSSFSKSDKYKNYVKLNLDTLLRAYNEYEYGISWSGVKNLRGYDYVTQSSAIDLLLVGRQMELI